MQGLRQAAENSVHKEDTSADFRRTAVRFLFFFFFFLFFFLLFFFSFFGYSLPAHTQWNGIMLLNVHRGEEAY